MTAPMAGPLIASRGGGPLSGTVTIGAAQARTVGELLAAAFHDEPVTRWLLPDRDQRPALIGGLFTGVVRDSFAGGFVDIETDDHGRPIAAAVWFDRTQPTVDSDSAGAQAVPADLAEWRQAEAARWGLLDAAMSRQHPPQPHQYLMLVGVHPAQWGCGIGTRLLAGRHSWLDACGIPAYLEATSVASRSLYLRLGYLDYGPALHPDHGAPLLWPMWRRPQGLTVPRPPRYDR